MQEIQVQSLHPEDPLEDETATHFSIHARIIPWTEEPGGLQFMVLQKSRTRPSTHIDTQRIIIFITLGIILILWLCWKECLYLEFYTEICINELLGGFGFSSK